MATSGNTIWTQTRDELIAGALRKLMVLAEGESPNANQIAAAIPALNGFLSALQSMGLFLWKREEVVLSLVAGQVNYSLGIGATINIPYPFKLTQAVVDYINGSQIDMEIVPHANFITLPNNSTGVPLKGTYQPKNSVGIFSVWPTPDTSAVSQATIRLYYQKPFDMFVSGTDTADFPQEWSLAVTYGLADLLSDEYGLPLEDRSRIDKQASKYMSLALAGSNEDTSVFFFPQGD